MVEDFATAVNANNTVTVSKLYKAFLPLVYYCGSVDMALLEKPDSVVTKTEILSTEQNRISVRYLMNVIYNEDLDNLNIIKGLGNADTITRNVVSAGNWPNESLAMLYPNVSRLGAFNISGKPMSIVCSFRSPRKTEVDGVDIETTVTIAQTNSGAICTQNVSFMMVG